MALSLVPALTLQFFDDSKFLGPESDAILSAVPSSGGTNTLSHEWGLSWSSRNRPQKEPHGMKMRRPADSALLGRSAARCAKYRSLRPCVPRTASMHDPEANNADNGDAKKPKAWLTAKHVPYIMAVHDCFGTMAAGMTIK